MENKIRALILEYYKGQYIYPECANFENFKKEDVRAELKKMVGEGYVVDRYFLKCDRCEDKTADYFETTVLDAIEAIDYFNQTGLNYCEGCDNEIPIDLKHLLLWFVRTDKQIELSIILDGGTITHHTKAMKLLHSESSFDLPNKQTEIVNSFKEFGVPKAYYMGKEISINVSEPDAELVSGLNDSAKIIHQNNKEKGFWEKDVNIGEMLMLVVSELGEAMEAHRKGKFSESFERFIWFNDWAKNNQSSDRFNFHNYIKDSFEDEIADAIIRLLDLSAGLNIDIEKHINFKVKYNKTREKLHGKKY